MQPTTTDEQRDYWRVAVQTSNAAAIALDAQATACEEAAALYVIASKRAAAASTAAHQAAILARRACADADKWMAHATERYLELA